MSEAQKRAQKKYDKKSKVVSIKYTPADMENYEKLKLYLSQTNQSMNGFMKMLVKNHFRKLKEVNDEKKRKNPRILTVEYVGSKDYKYLIKLRKYLQSNHIQADVFIKRLVEEFFDKGYDKQPKEKTPVQRKRDEVHEYYFYDYIEYDNLQYLYDTFGEDGMNKILDNYSDTIESDIEDILETVGGRYDDVVEELKERMEDEFANATLDEICEQFLLEGYL